MNSTPAENKAAEVNENDVLELFVRKYETLQKRRIANKRRAMIRQLIYSAKLINMFATKYLQTPSLLNIPVIMADLLSANEEEVRYGIGFYNKTKDLDNEASLQGLQFMEYNSSAWIRLIFSEKKVHAGMSSNNIKNG